MRDYFKEYFNFRILLLTFALVIIGLLSIYSATYDARATAAFYKQLIWAGIGTIVFLITAFIPVKTIQRLAFPFYILTMIMLIIVLVTGKTISGSKSWLGIGGMGIQPSELAKVATSLALAAFLSRATSTIQNPKHFFIAIGIVLLPMILILAQPDLGTSIIFFGLIIPVLYWVGVSNFILLAILTPIVTAIGALFGTIGFLIAVLLCGVVLYYTRENRFIAVVAFTIAIAVGVSVQTIYDRLPTYQQKRISTFLNPEKDRLGAGYNVEQSKVAIGSGGLFGKGYLRGTQTQLNFIPEQWTDFIFCVPAEEFGLIGASVVIFLFGGLIFYVINLAGICKNRFGSISSIAFAGILTIHFLINIGMALGNLPVIGIPLPFLSYGGSALFANMLMMGLLMSFYTGRKEY